LVSEREIGQTCRSKRKPSSKAETATCGAKRYRLYLVSGQNL
jgi:hypothetical protein